MISGIFIFNHKGEILINRLFREDIKYGGSRPQWRSRSSGWHDAPPAHAHVTLSCVPPLVRAAPRRSVAEIFRIHVIANPDVRTPVVTFGTTTFFHVRTDNLYLCAVSKLNVNTALVSPALRVLLFFLAVRRARGQAADARRGAPRGGKTTLGGAALPPRCLSSCTSLWRFASRTSPRSTRT